MAEDDTARRARGRLGTVLKGKYRLEAILGVGGMATVYRATHRNRAEFAVKMLHAELSLSSDLRTRFLREGYAANSVVHPGIVRVVDDDVTEDGSAFLVMDLMDGLDADQLAEHHDRKLPVQAAAAIVYELLDVLAAAHRAGIVHRDIKPANVFLTRDGSVKVLDFGIARVADAAAGEANETGGGAPLGTPQFMAPEQALGRSAEIDPRTDVWAAGATLFSLLSGRGVHEAGSTFEVLVLAATRPAQPLATVAPHVPPALCAIVDRALEVERSDRWASAEEMRAAIEQVARNLAWSFDRDTIATLIGDSRGRVLAAAALSSAPTLPAESAAPESMSPRLHVTSAPVAHGRHDQNRTSRPRARASIVVVALAVLGAGLGGIVLRGSALRRHAVPAASTGAAVAPPGPPMLLILGFDNKTMDPVFDGGTLDVVLESALTRSSTFYTLAGADVHHFVADADPKLDTFDEHSLGGIVPRVGRPILTIRGSIARSRAGYALSATVIDVSSGAEVAAQSVVAPSLERVVPSVALIASGLRAQLHDSSADPVPSEQCGASVSLEADHEYAIARSGEYAGGTAGAVTHAQQAVDEDPDFALAQVTLGRLLYNEGREAEAERHLAHAMELAGHLSDREQASTRILYHLISGALDDTIQDCEQAIERWPADARSPLTRLSVAYMLSENVDKGVEIARRAATEYPHSAVPRANLVGYEAAAGQLELAEHDARQFVEDFGHGGPLIAMVVVEALLGHHDEALALCKQLEAYDRDRGAAARADLAIYDGRLDDAKANLEGSIQAQEASHRVEAAAASWAMLGETFVLRGDLRAGREAARHAAASEVLVTRFRASRVLLQTDALTEGTDLAKRIEAHPGRRAELYAALLKAEASLARGAPADALSPLRAVGASLDSWWVHADLARAYLALGDRDQAKRELQTCVTRKGQGALVFPDSDSGTLRYVREITDALGRLSD